MNKRILLTVLVLPLLMAITASAGSKLPDTIVLSPESLHATKQKVLGRDRTIRIAYQQFMKDADRALNGPVRSVTLKPKAGPSGDKHDYWSISPYCWPNPDTPTGLPFVRRDGKHNPEALSERYDRSRMNGMSEDVLTLALAFFMTENERYAIKATTLVRAWFIDRFTRMNPNMEYGQSRPGAEDHPSSGIIETRDLIRVVDAARLLEPSRAWGKADTRKLGEWFTEYTQWLMDSDIARREAEMENNHGTWFDAQVAVFATYTGNTNLARALLGTVERRRIIRQILPDGSMPRELKKDQSRHNTFFNLQAFFVLATVGEQYGIGLWKWKDTTGASIRQALDFAAPFIDPLKPWPHDQIDTFSPEEYIPLFRRATVVYKDESYLEFLDALDADMLQRHRSALFY